MPTGLAIDHERPLNGTMPPYAQHVVVHTGRSNWDGRIEDDEKGEQGRDGNLARRLKEAVGRGGRWFDVGMSLCIDRRLRLELMADYW